MLSNQKPIQSKPIQELPTIQDYTLLDSEYNTSKDFTSLYDRRFSTEYLMVRSFKKNNLEELLTKHNILFNKKDKLDVTRT